MTATRGTSVARRFSASLFAICLGIAAGCGGDDDDDGNGDGGDGGDDNPADAAGGDIDSGSAPDGAAAPDAASADAASVCPLAANLGAIELSDQEAFLLPQDPKNPGGPQVRTLVGIITQGVLVAVDLNDGAGVFFPGEVAPGTYTIADDDADPTVCGLCVSVFISAPKGGQDYFFFATSGSLQLDSVDETLEGTLTGLTVQEIELPAGTPLPGGCQSEIESMPFSAPLTTQGAFTSQAPSGPSRGRLRARGWMR